MEWHVEPGSLLAASPEMLDPNFMHKVVLMCMHGAQGAHGLVVNGSIATTINVLLPDHPILSKLRFPVHQGGPVGHDTLQFVHRLPSWIPGGYELCEGLHFGGELDALARVLVRLRRTAHKKVRLILGYSGWGAAQLEAELASGAWLPSRTRVEWIFGEEPQTTWRTVVRSIGSDAAGLEDLPPDVSWN
jgi:putative transcriptional regulator